MKPFIFLNNMSKKYLLKLSSLTNEVIRVRHIPSITKEWKNNVYFFNLAKIKNLPVFDSLSDKLLSVYFNSCFQIGKYKVNLLKTEKKLYNQLEGSNKLKRKKLRLTRTNKGFTKVYISKSELNHSNNKVTLNFYIHNRKGMSYLRKIQTTELSSKKFVKKFIILSTLLRKNVTNEFIKETKLRKKIILYKLISILEGLKLKFNLNQYKFEEKLLYILADSLTKFYRKKVEFNIINLKSIAFNSDIFTKILTLKSKSKRINPHKIMNFIFNKATVHRTNKIKNKTPIRKKTYRELLLKIRKQNKEILNMNKEYKYSAFVYRCLNKIYQVYTNINTTNLHKKIFDSIHYKNIGGIRLEIKGRLTWRYRADRSQLKARKKGGFRNLESSYQRLPTIMKRSNEEYNLKYSLLAGKRHVGAFAVKGWLSGK